MQLVKVLAMFGYHKRDKGSIHLKTAEKFGKGQKTQMVIDCSLLAAERDFSEKTFHQSFALNKSVLPSQGQYSGI